MADAFMQIAEIAGKIVIITIGAVIILGLLAIAGAIKINSRISRYEESQELERRMKEQRESDGIQS